MHVWIWACASSDDLYMDRAQELYQQLEHVNWSQPEGQTGLLESTSPHGPAVRIWWNDEAADSPDTAFLDGSILLKESYFDMTGHALRSLLLMSKDLRYNDANNWFWASYDVDGGIQSAGSPDVCISCHETSTTDFVLFLEE